MSARRSKLTDIAKAGQPAGLALLSGPSTNGHHLTASDAPAVRLVTASADTITPKAVRWMWPGRVPFGMLSEIVGNPGDGKSTITADIAARASTGWTFPPSEAGKAGDPLDVLMLSAEDSAEHVIRPRLEAAGADLKRCHILCHVLTGDKPGPLVLPDHFDLVRAEIAAKGVKLVILDPLNSFISGRVDGNTDTQVRSALLYPMKQLAEDTGVAVLLVRHMNKGGSGPAVYRGIGSIGFTGTVRVSLATGRTQGGTRYLACAKSNIGPEPKAIEYGVATLNGSSRIDWGPEVELSADELLSTQAPQRNEARASAADFLRDLLAAGPVAQTKVYDDARHEGISERTLKRAKAELGVISRKTGFAASTWVWELPAAPKGATEAGQLPD